MNKNINKIRDILHKNKIDAFFVANSANASYLSHCRIPESCVLITRDKGIYFTDPRYQEQAFAEVKGLQVAITRNDLYSRLKEALNKARSVAFEADSIVYTSFQRLKKELPGAKLVPLKGVVEDFRKIKTPEEIWQIKKSISALKSALKDTKKFIKPGVSEHRICAELEKAMKLRTAARAAFDTIVASGPNSSKPHAVVTDRKIKRNDIVLIDAGADFNGYKSDLTRVYFLGKINVLIRRIHNLVLEAQASAISRVKPGIKICEIDRAARDTIEKYGYGKYFLHSTGHGTGLEVHERPCISLSNQEILLPGMVFTVEPAIYFPGKFGIRIEDMVLVTNKGCEVLTK